MFRRIYAVYDKLAKDIATNLLMFPNDTVASRSFVDMVNSSGTGPNTHPDDYELVCFGELALDEVSGVSLISAAPRVVISGTQVKNVSDPNAGMSGLSEEARRQLSLQV